MVQPEPVTVTTAAFEALADEDRLPAHSAAAALVLAIAACVAARDDARVLVPVSHDVALPFDLRTMIGMGGGVVTPIGRADRVTSAALQPATAAALVLRGGEPLLEPPVPPDVLLAARRLALPTVVVAPPGAAADRWLDAAASLVVAGDHRSGVLWGEPALVERARVSPHAAALVPT